MDFLWLRMDVPIGVVMGIVCLKLEMPPAITVAIRASSDC
jgi:hypothetical protein